MTEPEHVGVRDPSTTATGKTPGVVAVQRVGQPAIDDRLEHPRVIRRAMRLSLGLGPKRVASELRRENWGAIVVVPNGIGKALCRHGLNARAKRLGLIA